MTEPHSREPGPTRTARSGVGPPVGTLLAGRYRLLDLLGVGGMGMVFRARDEELGVDVAVKVLRTEAAPSADLEGLRERLRSELLLGRRVSHRHVVRIHDLGQDGEHFFLTMDLIAGRSLESVLRSEGRLEVERAVAVGRQIADGLDAAHREGVVHRDLKPANVLLDAEDRAYLTDFGVAKSLQSAGVTVMGGVVGTPDYLSPEQARGEGVDARSDLYAFGILLFEMLSGELPFDGGTWNERLARRVAGAPSRDLGALAPETPRFLRGIIARCLERRPAARYPDAAALLADLDAGRDPSRRKALRRNLLWAAAAGALLLAIVGARAWWDARPNAPAAPVAAAAAGIGATPPTATHSVLILPFADQSARASLQWSSRGLAEIVAAVFAESPSLRVVDPARVRRLLTDLGLSSVDLPPADLRRLGQLVGADRAVRGTLRAAGDRLRLELALLDPERDAAMSSAAGEGGESELFLVAERLAGELRSNLAPSSTPVDVPAADAIVLSSAPAAVAAYAAAQEALARSDLSSALGDLGRATDLDPEFALAWVRTSEILQSTGNVARAREAADRAVATAGRGRSANDRAVLEAGARRAILAGDPAGARRLYEQLLARYPNDVEARLAFAESCRLDGDLETAMETARAVTLVDAQHPRAWFQLGKYEIMSGKSREALAESLVRALVVQNRLGSTTGRADVVNAMGVAHQELGELEAAQERYREAAELRRAAGDRRGLAASLKNLAMLDLVAGRAAPAAAGLAQALAEAQAVGDPATTADIENALGGLDEERGRYSAALPHFRRALQLRREMGDDLLIGESLDSVGFCYYLLGDFDDALTYWQQAFDLRNAAGDRVGMVYARQNVAQLDLVRGHWDRALRSFLETLEESRELELPDGEAVAAGGIGRVALLQGRQEAALESFRSASAKLAEIGDARGEMEYALAEVEALLALGRVSEGTKRIDDLDAKHPTSDDESAQIGAERERLRSLLAANAGDGAAARAHAERALSLARESGGVIVALRARLVAASVESKARRAAALLAVGQEANRLGHAELDLEAGERAAEAQNEVGDRRGAERSLRAALDLAARCGTYGRAPILRERLASLLDATGRAPEAAAERRRAEEERRRMGAAGVGA